MHQPHSRPLSPRCLSPLPSLTLTPTCWLLSDMCHTQAPFLRGPQVSRGVILTRFRALPISHLINKTALRW